MFKQDFTLHIYSELLNSMKKAEYEFQTLEQFVKSPKDKVIIIRHDVDKRPFHSLAMANIEVEYGIYSSYYFRIINSSNNPVVIREIVSLGHEIGYHYEDLTLSKGNYDKANASFVKNLQYFRKYYQVQIVFARHKKR